MPYDEIIGYTTNANLQIQNTYRAGYKFYLPKGIKMLKHDGSNEIFSLNDTVFYMYVDCVSYFYQIKKDYVENQNVVYSKKIEKNDMFGYVEIKNGSNKKYFLEIMYNYAKIEVMVENDEIENTIAYAMTILSSISYHDEVLKNMMGENVLKSNELEHNIFESAETESEYLQIVEEYGQYEEENVVDPDFIRR